MGEIDRVALLSRLEGAAYTIHVDPAGDDNDSGDASNPIATLKEAARRTPFFSTGVEVLLSAGDHKIADNSASQLSDVFIGGKQSANGLIVRGTTSILQTVTSTGATDNVMTVSETLVAGALVGGIIEVEIVPGFFSRGWVIANTTNNITFAFTPTSWGGFGDLPTSGSVDILQLDSRVLPPDTNSNLFFNRFFVQGNVCLDKIDFDGNNGTGGFAGPTAQRNATSALQTCRIRNWSQGANMQGPCNVLSCWFQDNSSYAAGVGDGGFVSGNNYFQNSPHCIQVFDQSKAILGAGQVAFIDKCARLINGRFTEVNDFHSGYWLDNSGGGQAPAEYALLGGAGGVYQKRTTPITKRGGSADWPLIIESNTGGNTIDLLDSANASIGTTTDYVNLNGTIVTLADYNAGVLPATGVRRFGDDRGTFVFD